MYPYFHRLIEKQLKELFQTFSIVIISGARQVGKSRLLQQIYADIPRVVFDPVVDVENAKADPDLFLTNHKTPLILDEIQYAPEVVPAIKRFLEKERKPSQYILTGSQQWGIMKLLAESLAGRAVFLDLEGFSILEITEQKRSWLEDWLKHANSFSTLNNLKPSANKVSLYAQIWRGFLPEAQFIPENQIPVFHSAYQRTYIERDVRQVAEISDLHLFSRFYRLCGALTGQEINYSELGRELGITPQTASRWLNILKATFQWFEIPPYAGNTIKRVSEKPKGYFSDSGLACSALAISTPQAVGSHPTWGNLFETVVASEIKKQCCLLPTPPNFYHWRSHGGAEVDLLLERDGQFFPIEIKAKSHPTKQDAKGIAAFRKTYPNLAVRHGLILAPTSVPYPITEQEFVIPWDAVV